MNVNVFTEVHGVADRLVHPCPGPCQGVVHDHHPCPVPCQGEGRGVAAVGFSAAWVRCTGVQLGIDRLLGRRLLLDPRIQTLLAWGEAAYSHHYDDGRKSLECRGSCSGSRRPLFPSWPCGQAWNPSQCPHIGSAGQSKTNTDPGRLPEKYIQSVLTIASVVLPHKQAIVSRWHLDRWQCK